MKKVYMALSADFIHSGHLNVIKVARDLGELTIGLLTDTAISKARRVPLLNYEQRKIIVENIVGVAHIVAQDSQDYTDNLQKLRPDYVVHGTDWREGPRKKNRDQVIETLKEWNGSLVEPEYSKGLSSSQLATQLRMQGITPELRRKSLRRLLEVKPVVRILEVHNGLTGLIVEKTSIETEDGTREFDGMWESSLTDSTSKGKPDNSSVDVSSRVHTIEQILEVTTKPMIVDADNGGLPEHFRLTVKTLERLGVSAVIIEDKVGPKRNSLFGAEAGQKQDSVEEFSEKISTGKRAQVTEDFMVIARIESLILQMGMEDALMRAAAYVEAGSDAIMIHSKEKKPDEVLEFCKKFKADFPEVPIVVVPSTYDTVSEEELQAVGVNIVIFANHLLRSAYPSMEKTAKLLLQHRRAFEVRDYCQPIKEIISMIPVED